jgi:NAD-dependent dihydropyrimidine dehydrogenase PreA subunit
MYEAKKDFRHKIKQEILLPEINPDVCVHSFFDKSDCQACVDACHQHAWLLDDEGLGLDTSACDGCGLCVPSCPGGALHITFPWIIRSFNGRIFALFACEQSSINKQSVDLLSCIHALGLRQLLLLYNCGIRYILISTGNCDSCSSVVSEGIFKKIDQVNNLLSDRNKPLIKILHHSSKTWERIYASDEIITQGSKLSRRTFLRSGGNTIRQQLMIMDTLNIPESRTIPPGQLLSSEDNKELHWPSVPILDENLCNGCDICIKLCPTQALKILSEENDLINPDILEKTEFKKPGLKKTKFKTNSSLTYYINPQSCTGCGVCEKVCELHAISIHNWHVSSAHHIDLLTKRCSACGNDFHLPIQNSQSKSSLCRICSQINHSKNLYQILE